MSVPKPVPLVEEDPAVAAFDRALPADEPLLPEEAEALERRIAGDGPGVASDELLRRLRPAQ